MAELLVRQSKAEARENGKLKRAAELISFFGRVEQATAEKGLALSGRSFRRSSARC